MPAAPNTADLAPYKNLYGKKEPGAIDPAPYFICEGKLLAEEAIKAASMGQLRFISLLCNSKQSEEWESKIPRQAKLFTLDADELNSLAGFDFHRGVLCCCAVPETPSDTLLLQASRLLVLPHLDNVDNLGQLIRAAAALGMDAILIGLSPNPFARRCVRVSMGAVWKIPIFKRDDPERLLNMWLQHAPGIKSETAGTASAPGAESVWEWTPAPRTALVLGHESSGLDEFWQARCVKHIRVPLARQIDSLNVSAAGAIIMARLNCFKVVVSLDADRIARPPLQ